jgi:hypothetical protein
VAHSPADPRALIIRPEVLSMKGIFRLDDAAMPLVDHQVGTITLALSTPHDEIVRNTRALARTAREGGMPLVLTSSQEDHFQGLQLPDLQALVPDDNARRVKRPGVAAAWQYTPFCEAVERTGRTKLIMSGLTNDVCIVYPAISAVEDGYAVQPDPAHEVRGRVAAAPRGVTRRVRREVHRAGGVRCLSDRAPSSRDVA